jgi:aldehyde:ferredoxin oxidoreductase
MDVPPKRWFNEPLTKGAMKGYKLDKEKYYGMLTKYYRLRGWDEKGIPRKSTLKKFGLTEAADQLGKIVKLAD